MRLIDADALKKVLEIEQYNDYDDLLRTERLIDQAPTIKAFTLADIEEQYAKGMEKGLEEAKRPHGEWIPVSERLPEKNGYYLVTTDGSHNDVIDIAEYGKFWNHLKYDWMWNKASKILAWMPLPEPYRKEGEKNG